MEPNITARIRREVGTITLQLEALFVAVTRQDACKYSSIAGRVAAARDLLALAMHDAGQLLTAELSDAEREQAAEAGRRA